VRVYLPGGGWADYDPTNGSIGGAGLIRTAVSADPAIVTPLHGSYRGQGADFRGMRVEIDLDVQDPAQPVEHRRVAEGG
jgi:transglutaminase-like putative cysteine protease